MRLFLWFSNTVGGRFTYNEQSFWHFATKLCILNRTALDRISKDRKSNASLSSLKSWQKSLKKPHKGNTGKGPFICLESRTFFCLNSWNQLTFMKKVTYLLYCGKNWKSEDSVFDLTLLYQTPVFSKLDSKSKFKISFYDSKSKFWNVMLHTFHWEMVLKFTP